VHINIVAQPAEICKKTFRGWEDVPKHFKTKAAWKRAFHTVAKGEQSTATVIVEQSRRFDSIDAEYKVEKSFKLFHVSQTKPTRKTALNTAQHEFWEHFGHHADRNKLIRWTKGKWQTGEHGEKWWDKTADVWGWKIFQEHFGMDEAIDHLNGKEIYGVFGAEKSSYLLIDLDLHNQPLDLFKNRFRVLLDAFWGKWRCHFQVSNEKAGGVHIILFFGVQSPLKTRRAWILKELAKLDEEHPGLGFTKIRGGKRGFNIEVFPDPAKAHRLPLCRGRTMLLDKPLPLVKRRGKEVQDVVGYMAWLKNPDRQFMNKDEVFDFVGQKLDLACSSDNSGRKPKEPGETKLKDGKAGQRVALPMKGRTRGAIVGFWGRSEPGHFVHLNAAIAVTLRALYFEGLSQNEAVDLVIRYVDELTNPDLSSRLANNKSAIHEVIRRDANKIWDNNGGQVDNENSSKKWRAVAQRWRDVGFKVSDKSTWDRENRLGTVVDCEDFEFTEDEKRLLVKEMAVVLVGKKQARKEAKQQEVIWAVKFFLRYVKCHDGEISVSALPVILKDFDLKLANHDKQQRFLDLLKDWGWIYVRADYFHPDKHGGSRARGRARAYGIGPAMVGKLRSSSLYYTPQPQQTYILSPIFSGMLPDEVEVPCFEDYFDSLDGDFVAKHQEVLLDGG
jgi:hypothetical protein